MITLAILQSVPIDGATAVSVTVLVMVLGAAWKLSAQLNRIDEKLTAAQRQLAKLESLPERLGRLEEKVLGIEREVDAMWKELKHRDTP